MAKMLLAFLTSFFVLTAYSQNLVGNTGFEERNVCIEYQVRCAPEAWFFIPRYSRMSPVESDSNHFELILMGNPQKPFSVGNFLYTKLFCPLVAGEKYQLKMKVHTNGFEFDYLDIWTGPTEPWRGRYSFSSVKASFTIPPDSIAGEHLKQWRTLSYTFTAKGGERFFLLGSISQQPLSNAKKRSRRKDVIEYGIDDISLYAVNPALPKCGEYEAIKDQVYRNDYRHPGRFIDDIEIDSTLLPRIKKDPPVVIDTPIVKPSPKTDTLIIPDVLFHFNSSKLNPAFASRLDSLGNKIKNRVFTKLLIAGHTDNVGTEEYNLKLSSDRSATIKNYISDKFFIRKEIIDTIGYGESQPRATNTTAAGRQQNRRVEIIIYY